MANQVCVNLIESDVSFRTPLNSVTQFMYSAPEGYYWKYGGGPNGIKVTDETTDVGVKYTSITTFTVSCVSAFGSGQLIFDLVEEDNNAVVEKIKVNVLS